MATVAAITLSACAGAPESQGVSSECQGVTHETATESISIPVSTPSPEPTPPTTPEPTPTPTPAPLTVQTEQASIDTVNSANDLGALICEKWGLRVRLEYGNDQWIVDKPNTAGVLTEIFGSHKIGLGTSMVADHNTQTGASWGNAAIGDKLYVKAPYGEFIYQVLRVGVADNVGDATFVMQDDGLDVVAFAQSGTFNGLILFTCYPLNQSGATTQRFVVFAEMVDGTEII